MKARFLVNLVGRATGHLCYDYPECKCEGHYVYEKNKRKKE